MSNVEKARTWATDSVFYHIYPLGLLGAPEYNDFESPPQHRLPRLLDWTGHLRSLGVNAIYLGPVFESDRHGYDTADYYRVDRRLGTNEDLAGVVSGFHANGIRVILDGVFHHVGRNFPQFRDLQEYRGQSAFRDWFVGVDFGRQSPYGDPFSYEGWKGHYNLVKLNLQHPEVRKHLFDAVAAWFREFDIDGLRLDVAEEIDLGFLRDLAAHVRQIRPDAYLLGEVIHGDYRRWAGPSMLDATTNYECYKGLYSSHNDRNYFEIAHSLQRQFGEGGMYRGLPLYNFADNHDVDRVASTLRNPAHLYPLYFLLFTMPGVPSIYAGSEWGLQARKSDGGDHLLRPALESPEAAREGAPHPELAGAIARFAAVRRESAALRQGDYRQMFVAHEQLAFARRAGEDYALVLVNAADAPATFNLDVDAPGGGALVDLLEPGCTYERHGNRVSVEVPPHWGRVLGPGR